MPWSNHYPLGTLLKASKESREQLEGLIEFVKHDRFPSLKDPEDFVYYVKKTWHESRMALHVHKAYEEQKGSVFWERSVGF